MNFNRKSALAILDANNATLSSLFSRQTEEVNPKGYAIFWKDKRIKPKSGKVDYYESEDAAKKAIDRNCSFGWNVYKLIAQQVLGIEITNDNISECPNYRKYFRLDLQWKDDVREGRINSRSYINARDLNEDDLAIRTEREKEEDAFEKFCRGALNTMVTKWLKDGTLEIKAI